MELWSQKCLFSRGGQKYLQISPNGNPDTPSAVPTTPWGRLLVSPNHTPSTNYGTFNPGVVCYQGAYSGRASTWTGITSGTSFGWWFDLTVPIKSNNWCVRLMTRPDGNVGVNYYVRFYFADGTYQEETIGLIPKGVLKKTVELIVNKAVTGVEVSGYNTLTNICYLTIYCKHKDGTLTYEEIAGTSI